MEAFYAVLFAALVLLAALLEFQHPAAAAGTSQDRKTNAVFKQFRNNYLVVYSLMMAGDWLQGPYIYALYEHYGYHVGDIGQLFIAGFASSMVFGTLAGALADTYGRKSASLLYVVTYSLSCVTKHSGDFRILLMGRALGGISTSLLFSAFESWLVAEHNKNGFPESQLRDTFSKSVFFGAGMMAILSGLIGNILVEEFRLGPVAPFDAAIVVMVVGGVIVMLTWSENYGDNSHHTLIQQFRSGMLSILADKRVALLGGMQALFEASMYTFVFLWTPALSPRGEKIPHGFVFSCFMTACMAGSAFTGLLMKRVTPQLYMPAVYASSALSMVVPFIFHLEPRGSAVGSSLGDNGKGGISFEGKLQLLAFCVFEGCVGMFWPSMMALRAHYVPEETRSTIMNIFRIPLNLFVCLVLYKVSSFPLSVMFGLCVAFLLISLGMQLYLNKLTYADEDDRARGGSTHASTHEVSPSPVKRSSVAYVSNNAYPGADTVQRATSSYQATA